MPSPVDRQDYLLLRYIFCSFLGVDLDLKRLFKAYFIISTALNS